MMRALIVLMATLMAAPAFAQDPGTALSLAGPAASAATDVRPTALDLAPARLREAVQAQTQPVSQSDWQRQYDAAIHRRKSGQTKFLIGLGAGIAGMAMMMASMDCTSETRCHNNEALGTTGALVWLASGVPFWWGIVDWAGGSGAVHSLEATRPREGSSPTVTISDHQALQLSLGPRSSVAYRVTW